MNRFKNLAPEVVTERKRLLGERIQQRRAELDLTQEAVAQLGGISSETLRQYEVGRGGDRPTERILESIDAALGWCLGSSKATLIAGAEPVVDDDAKLSPTDTIAPLRPTTTHALPATNNNHVAPARPAEQVSVDRDQLRQLVALTTGLIASAAQSDDPKELLGDLTALNRLAYEMTLSSVS